MLELLILYSLHKQELTLYGLRQNIAKHFGEISIPSHGALFPCIKKLEDKNLISVRKKFSEGGKKYTYYSASGTYIKYFNDKFMEFNNAKSETLDSYLSWLKIRLITIDLLESSYISQFKEKGILKLNFFENSINEKSSNSYIELTKVQKELLKINLKEIEDFKSLLESL